MALLAAVGLTCGISAAFHGYYDITVWGVGGLGLLSLALALLIALPAPRERLGLVALAGLVGFALWSELSTSWAEGADAASVEASRWIVYSALFAILLSALGSRRQREMLLLGATTTGVLGVAAYLVARMLFGDGPSLFFAGRLSEPLGYVNGQAGFLLLGFWPLVAVAEAALNRWLAGAAAGLALVLVALAVLCQTRAAPFALAISAVLVLAAVPGRRRRLWVLVVIGAGFAVAAGPLLDVYSGSTQRRPPSEESIHSAIGATLAVAILCGLLWSAVCARRMTSRASSVALAVVLSGALVVGLVAVDHPVRRVQDQYRNFVELRAPKHNAQTRLLNGGGFRYDYWRVSLKQFSSHPLRGVGAGNFPAAWLRERRVTEEVRQQHSLLFQTLADLGLIGFALLLVFLGAVFAGLVRWARASERSASARFLAVAASGTFLVWLAHTSVDWLHLIPGLTGTALCAAAVLLQRPEGPAPGEPARPAPLALAGACAALILAGAVVVAGPTVSERYREAGQKKLRTDPRAALADADDALSFNDESLPNYFLKAAAYARLNNYPQTRAQLLEAARREPSSFLPWALLGDVEVRRGDLALARRAYREAARRNPRDPGLRRLARTPALALPTPRP